MICVTYAKTLKTAIYQIYYYSSISLRAIKPSQVFDCIYNYLFLIKVGAALRYISFYSWKFVCVMGEFPNCKYVL